MVNAAAEHQTVGAAVLVYHCDAVVDGVAGVLDVDLLPVQVNRTRGNRVKAENSTHDFASSCADQTGKAEDFACAELEIDVPEASAVRLVLRQVLDLKDNVTDGHRGVLGENVRDFAADHAGHELVRVVVARRAGFDPLTVTDDGDVVRDAEDLVHLVGDVKNGDALLAERENLLEQNVYLLIADG